MLTESDLRDALRVCYDPEFGVNIVDLGRVHAVSITPDESASAHFPRVAVSVALLPRDEVQDAMLAAQVTNRLFGLPEIATVDVSFAEPVWTPEHMTTEGRHERGRRQGLIQLGTTPGQV